MISVLKTRDEYIYAYAEWFRVDENGYSVPGGERVFIKYLWIHPMHEGMGKIIQEINKDAGDAKYVYWRRLKYNQRITACLSRERLAKMGEKYGRR